MLFAHPLDMGFETDSIKYENEIISLKEKLIELDKKINFKYGVFTYENLKDSLNQQPTILHLICHGALDRQTKKSFLLIEDEKGQKKKFHS